MTDYRNGDRVALVLTDDPYTFLEPGDLGTVVRTEDGVVDVHWDSGSTLSMLLDEGDEIILLDSRDAMKEG